MKDNNIESLHSNIVTALVQVNVWIKLNKLKLSIWKTNYIIFQNKSVRRSLAPVLMDGETIKNVKGVKNLGVAVVENFNWGHIKNTCSKIQEITGVLYISFCNLSTVAMIRIHFTIC